MNLYLKTEVDIKEFERCLNYMKQINSIPFKDIIWTLDGNELEPETNDLKEIYNEWEFIGLNNVNYGKMLIEEHKCK